MKINYTITQAKKDKLAAANPATLSISRLLYHHTQGVVRLRWGEEEALELDVPVFDLAWCLLHVVEKLQTDSSTVFQFTESADVIMFRRSEEAVLITTDFQNGDANALTTISER